MNKNLFFEAFFRFRNFATLLCWCIAVYLLSGEAQMIQSSVAPGITTSALITGAYGTGAVFYLALVIQSFFSKSFREEVERKEKRKAINDLNRQCNRLSYQIKSSASPIYKQKLKKILMDKDDIFRSLKRGEERSYLKEKIVEKSLNLVISYIKLLTNYSIRSKELADINISDVSNKINVNRRKLSFMRDERMISDISSIIEMDEMVIQRVRDEKNELERIHARLDYIESMIGMFKHQIISSIESEEMIEKLDTAVNEATALDNVLQERRRNQIRMQ
jgi:hypothetical protein